MEYRKILIITDDSDKFIDVVQQEHFYQSPPNYNGKFLRMLGILVRSIHL